MGSNPISLTDVLGLKPGGGGSASGRSSGSSQSTGKEINVYGDRIVDPPRPAESAAPETDVTTNRMWGAFTFAGGVAELALAAFAVYVSGGTLTPLVGGLVAHGADNVATGGMQIWTGKQQRTLTHQVISKAASRAGLSQNDAENAGAFGDMVVGTALGTGTGK